ncbi:GNAT family N-acetyltransferase [Microvirga brassicacearum]|uniref:GNAT family N-acetyltransferase n=1 Tax=Microvirga brassicacearum TaxID=2580413 RepID=UPI003B84634A
MRPLEIADAEAVQQRFPRWEIVRFLSKEIPWPYPADGALAFIRDHALPAMEKETGWHWPIRPKVESEQLVGIISLMDKPGNNRGFWIDPDWQGQGLMLEASSAVTDFWFETLGRPVLQVPKAVANERSRRISERQTMRIVEMCERDYVSGRFPAEVWEITREEWRNRPR